MGNTSVRKAEIVQQISYLDGFDNGKWKEKLIQKLESSENIKAWAAILHDADINPDGTPKAPHVHIVVELVEPVKMRTVAGYVGVPENCVNKILQRIKYGKSWFSDVGGALSYLTHRNAKGKHPYSDDEVFAKPDYDWQTVRAASEQKREDVLSFRKLLEKIESGEIKRCDICDHIDMQQYIDHKMEINSAFEFAESKVMKNSDRDITVIYMTGPSGSGKTTLAKQFCENQGLSFCVSASSRDALQDYKGQDVMILDDLRPNSFRFSDLVKLLDNHTSSSASSRYRDKYLDVKYIIVTSVLPLDSFYLAASVGEDTLYAEPIEQIRRRCSFLVEVSEDEIKVFEYNEDLHEYFKINAGSNPVKEMFISKKGISTKKKEEICRGFGLSESKGAKNEEHSTA